MKIQVYT